MYHKVWTSNDFTAGSLHGGFLDRISAQICYSSERWGLPGGFLGCFLVLLLGNPPEAPILFYIVKSVPLNFVVNTSLIQYCVYYEI